MASYFTSAMNPTLLHNRDVNAMVDRNLTAFEQANQAFSNFMGDKDAVLLTSQCQALLTFTAKSQKELNHMQLEFKDLQDMTACRARLHTYFGSQTPTWYAQVEKPYGGGRKRRHEKNEIPINALTFDPTLTTGLPRRTEGPRKA